MCVRVCVCTRVCVWAYVCVRSVVVVTGLVRAQSLQLCPTLCDSMDYSLPGFSVKGFSRQEYWSGLPCSSPGALSNLGIELASTCVSCLAGRYFVHWATWEVHVVAQTTKCPPARQETWVWSLDWEDPLDMGIAIHSNILAWRIAWTEKSGGLEVHGVAQSWTRLNN